MPCQTSLGSNAAEVKSLSVLGSQESAYQIIELEVLELMD